MNTDGKKILIPALFLHIQKTAGTSIVQMAAKHYGNTNTSSHGDFIGKTPQDFKNTGFVSGHFGYNFAKPLMSGRYSFVFLRDPIERILSFYYFCKNRDPMELPIYRIANELSLEGFLLAGKNNRLVKRRLWNSQVWRLASGPGPDEQDVDDFSPKLMLKKAQEHLDTFSYVGFTETFDTDIHLIMNKLNIPGNHKPGKSNVTINRPATDTLPPPTIALIEELTQFDRKLYDTAWQKRKLQQKKSVRSE